MGYYTNYTLNIIPFDEGIWDIIEIDDDLGFLTDDYPDSRIWYEHEDIMKGFSTRFPDTVFMLGGRGEENRDIWYKYFKNGKMQVCKAIITFPPFDEKELK